MKKYRYIKSNAFTSGASLGNPAAALIAEDECLTPEQMQQIATEHKGFVMEIVFCSPSETAACKLTYYSSECEVNFCGHGTIATMYSIIKVGDDQDYANAPVATGPFKVTGFKVNDEIDTERYDNPVDACYEMILKLHEFKIL